MFPKGISFFFCDFETTGIKVDNFDSTTYPIELGYILTDEYLNLVDSNNFYIQWDWMNSMSMWLEHPDRDVLKAYEIHRIELEDIKRTGYIVNKCCEMITSSINKLPRFSLKPTIISDNAYFETFLFYKLFNNSKISFPFHYTSWDINLLVKAADIKNVKEKSHSAIDDVSNMYIKTIRALEKIGYFDMLLEH